MNFTKASTLSDTVIISMIDRLPALIEYKAHDAGYLRYYIYILIQDFI